MQNHIPFNTVSINQLFLSVCRIKSVLMRSVDIDQHLPLYKMRPGGEPHLSSNKYSTHLLSNRTIYEPILPRAFARTCRFCWKAISQSCSCTHETTKVRQSPSNHLADAVEQRRLHCTNSAVALSLRIKSAQMKAHLTKIL